MGQKEDTDNYIVITGILETPKHLFFISLQGLYDKRKPFYGIYDKEKQGQAEEMHVAQPFRRFRAAQYVHAPQRVTEPPTQFYA